jgi:hypothetical protein
VTFWSASVGLPLAVVAGSTELRLAPFLTPGLGFGYATGGGESESGTRFMLGGEIGILMRNSFGLSASFQKPFIQDGKTTLGVNVSFRM